MLLLQCELCGKQYRDEIKQQLEPLIAGRRARRTRSRTVRVVNVNGETVRSVEAAEGTGDEPRPQLSWTRFWWVATCSIKQLNICMLQGSDRRW